MGINDVEKDYSDYDNFDMTLEECKLVFDSIEGLVVVDENGRIKYLSEDMLPVIELLEGEAPSRKIVGKHILEVHPVSKICGPLITGKEEKEHFYVTMGRINVAKIKPLYKDGKLKGAIDYDLFRDMVDLKRFFDAMVKLSISGIIDLSKSIEQIIKQHKKSKLLKYQVSDIIGDSPQIKQVKQRIHDISDSDATVLITGDTGCGKELVAHSVHNISRRRLENFVEINCAAIPENLVESELFGYEAGTFTGAQKGGKKGKFELADKGTIFLDEIDHLPYHIQPKLLRTLQEKEVSRIGGVNVPIDVRIIAATNKNLKLLIDRGEFRKDLYYRLNVLEIKMPSLRERKEDIPLLVENQIINLNNKLGKEIVGVEDEVMELFYRYSWPGNVRELQNVVERAMVGCAGSRLSIEHIKDYFHEEFSNAGADMMDIAGLPLPLEQVISHAEKKAIEKALELARGNRTKAAKILEISRPALYYKMEKYGMERDNLAERENQ